jgi:hypothetical protein
LRVIKKFRVPEGRVFLLQNLPDWAACLGTEVVWLPNAATNTVSEGADSGTEATR